VDSTLQKRDETQGYDAEAHKRQQTHKKRPAGANKKPAAADDDDDASSAKSNGGEDKTDLEEDPQANSPDSVLKKPSGRQVLKRPAAAETEVNGKEPAEKRPRGRPAKPVAQDDGQKPEKGGSFLPDISSNEAKQLLLRCAELCPTAPVPERHNVKIVESLQRQKRLFLVKEGKSQIIMFSETTGCARIKKSAKFGQTHNFVT
jgi:hypothetical protein